MEDDFASTFNRLLGQSDKSLTQVAALSGIDRAYLLRLSRGEKCNPSPSVVTRIYIALVADEWLLARQPTLVHGLSELATAAALTAAASTVTE